LPGIAIPNPVGNPELSEEQEWKLRKRMMNEALQLLKEKGK